MRLEKNIEHAQGVFVCYLKDEPKLWSIERVMQRHHAIKDFGRRECSLLTMLAHDREYAFLMAYFVKKYGKELEMAGYDPRRGDGVGVCLTSGSRGFMMYSIGRLMEPEGLGVAVSDSPTEASDASTMVIGLWSVLAFAIGFLTCVLVWR